MWLPAEQRVFWGVFVTIFYTLCAPQQYSIRRFFYSDPSASHADYLNQTVTTVLFSQFAHGTKSTFDMLKICADTSINSSICSVSTLGYYNLEGTGDSWVALDQQSEVLPRKNIVVSHVQNSTNHEIIKMTSSEPWTTDLSSGKLIANAIIALFYGTVCVMLYIIYHKPRSLHFYWTLLVPKKLRTGTQHDDQVLLSWISSSQDSAKMVDLTHGELAASVFIDSGRQIDPRPWRITPMIISRFLRGSVDAINDRFWHTFGKQASHVHEDQLRFITAKMSSLASENCVMREHLEAKDKDLTTVNIKLEASEAEVVALNIQLDSDLDDSSLISTQLGLAANAAQFWEDDADLTEGLLRKSESELGTIHSALREMCDPWIAEGEIEAVHVERATSENIITYMTARMKSLVHVNIALQESLKQKEQNVEELETDNANQKRQIEELSNVIISSARVASDLMEEIREQKEKIDDLTVSANCAWELSTQYQNDCKNAEKERDIAKQETILAEEETATANAETVMAKEEARQSELEADKDKQETAEAKEETAQVKLEASEAKRQETTCWDLYRKGGKQNESLLRENKHLQKERNETCSKIADQEWKHTNKVHDLEIKVLNLQEENRNAQATLAYNEEQLLAADAKVSALTMQATNQSDLLLEKSEYVRILEYDLSDLDKKYSLMNDNGEKLFGEFIEQQEMVLALQKKNNDFKTQLRHAKLEVTHSRRKHRGGKQHTKRAAHHNHTDMIVSPEFVPFGGRTYSALVRFNEKAFMVVRDLAGVISKRPTINFYCLILLGAKTQPSQKDQRRILQLLINVDITPAHKALLLPRPCRSKAIAKSNAPEKPRKIVHHRSATVDSLEDLFTKLSVNSPALGYRPWHRRSATTASLEDRLVGLRIEVTCDSSTATDISSPETWNSPARSSSSPVSSLTSYSDCDDGSTGSSGDVAASGTSENNNEIKYKGNGRSQGGDKNESDGNCDNAVKDTAKDTTDDTDGNDGSSHSAPPTSQMSCTNCKRSNHFICFKCSCCEERGESFFRVWGSHTIENCDYNPNATRRRLEKKKVARAQFLADRKREKEEQRIIDQTYNLRFGRY